MGKGQLSRCIWNNNLPPSNTLEVRVEHCWQAHHQRVIDGVEPSLATNNPANPTLSPAGSEIEVCPPKGMSCCTNGPFCTSRLFAHSFYSRGRIPHKYLAE